MFDVINKFLDLMVEVMYFHKGMEAILQNVNTLFPLNDIILPSKCEMTVSTSRVKTKLPILDVSA